jgi:hypothetical protein
MWSFLPRILYNANQHTQILSRGYRPQLTQAEVFCLGFAQRILSICDFWSRSKVNESPGRAAVCRVDLIGHEGF